MLVLASPPPMLDGRRLAAPVPLAELWWLSARAATPLPRAEAERRFAALLATSGDAIWRLCRFREKDAEARRDLYQEIALAIWQALPTFRGEASERAWALRIAHNVAASHVGRAVRRRQLASVAFDERDSQLAQQPDTGPERHLDLMARLASLDVLSQELVLLHLEGLSTRELADVSGLTTTNVTTRLNRARMRLSAEPATAPRADEAENAGARP